MRLSLKGKGCIQLGLDGWGPSFFPPQDAFMIVLGQPWTSGHLLLSPSSQAPLKGSDPSNTALPGALVAGQCQKPPERPQGAHPTTHLLVKGGDRLV